MGNPARQAQRAQEKETAKHKKLAAQARARAQEAAQAPAAAPAKMSGAKKVAVAAAVLAALGVGGWAVKKSAESGDDTATRTAPTAPVAPAPSSETGTKAAPNGPGDGPSPGTRAFLGRSERAERIPGMRGENWVERGKKHVDSGKEPYWTAVEVKEVTPLGWRPPREITAAQAFREFPYDDVPEVALYRTLEAPDARLALVIVRQEHKDGLGPLPARFAGTDRLREVQSQIRRIVNWLSANGIATAAQMEGCGESTVDHCKNARSAAYGGLFQDRYETLTAQEMGKLRSDIRSRAKELAAVAASALGMRRATAPIGTVNIASELVYFSQETTDAATDDRAGKLAEDIRAWLAEQADPRRPSYGIYVPQPTPLPGDPFRRGRKDDFDDAPGDPFGTKAATKDLLAFADVLEGWGVWRRELKNGPANLDPVFGGTRAAFFDGKIALLQATTDAFEDAHGPWAGNAALFDERETNMLKFACHPGYQAYGTCRILVMGASHDFLDQLKAHNDRHPEFQVSAIELTPALLEDATWSNVVRDERGLPVALRTNTKFGPPDTGRVIVPKRKPAANVAPPSPQK